MVVTRMVMVVHVMVPRMVVMVPHVPSLRR
jgi:hypothetical protein